MTDDGGDPEDKPDLMTYVCISGSQVDADGVCVEHGETACVIGVPVRSGLQRQDPDDLPEQDAEDERVDRSAESPGLAYEGRGEQQPSRNQQ